MQYWTFQPVLANLDQKHSKEKLAHDISQQFETADVLFDIMRWIVRVTSSLFLNDFTNLKTFKVLIDCTRSHSDRSIWFEGSSLSLFPPSSVRSGRPSISLSSHLCISSFWRLALSPLHGHVSPFPAARSRDRLACSWFNNCFVTLCVFVLQRSRLWSGFLKIWCALVCMIYVCIFHQSHSGVHWSGC